MKTKQERRKGSPYPELFRIRVAKEYLAGGISNKELATKYAIDRTLISHWVTNFVRKTKNCKIIEETPKRMPKLAKSSREQALEREIQQLKKEFRNKEKELETANRHVFALDTMIDVAEEMFDIEIRKKPGAKQ